MRTLPEIDFQGMEPSSELRDRIEQRIALRPHHSLPHRRQGLMAGDIKPAAYASSISIWFFQMGGRPSSNAPRISMNGSRISISPSMTPLQARAGS